MIIYATKQTVERYKLELPKELSQPTSLIVERVLENERGDRLLEWGAKLFYFNKRKCIQICNFASKFTLFLFDVKVDDIKNIGVMIYSYILELYKNDAEMLEALSRLFSESPINVFDKLTDKSAIATLNTTQSGFAVDGDIFYKYIDDGILKTMKINHRINYEWLFTMKVNGKTEHFYPGKKFREIVLERYSK